jgi:MoxR-like ATPase
MKQKIQTLLEQLNHGLVEREGTLKTALLTVLAGENLVLIGPPGTCKSEIARRIAKSFSHDIHENKNHAYFEYLLTKFSTPEEIFGPLSIKALKDDIYKRNTAGYLPTVKIAFLDEIFKASSSILNALLTILNERIYHNGSERQDVHMQALIAASNELPNDQEELSALYDRFLVRNFVDYVSDDNLVHLFKKTGVMPELSGESKFSSADLKSIKEAAESVAIPQEVKDAVLFIWRKHKETFKEDRRESLSDRRLKKVINLLCVSAATNGRNEVDLSDVFLLKNCLWNHQVNAVKVLELIRNTLQTFSRAVPQSEGTVITSPAAVLALTNSQLGTVVKGFKGRGTAQDPLLIQTLEELMDLSRPDVGLKGYHFRQNANIDCTTLSSWTDIPFNGHYDGGGHTIKYKNKKPQNNSGRFGSIFGAMSAASATNEFAELFSSIKAKSSITNLKLENLMLTKDANDSRITHCVSNISLISGTASTCAIIACESGAFLILAAAINCTISDCLVVLNMDLDNVAGRNNVAGGIVCDLTQGSLVERCFVTGAFSIIGLDFNGLASNCDNSTIRQCALGRIVYGEYIEEVSKLLTRISPGGLKSRLENNISISSNPGTDSSNGKDGQTVDEKLFKQRYFEHTLNWDFDTVWQWDNKENRPALRSAGLASSYQQAKSSGQDANMTDLLTQQIRANIWL